ncbi:hypothetical protein [Leptospira wolffii]|uniref:hypothetical protein n=1 Tax=Leptospira wolffii TaxID=409998 RepID=UPI0002DAD20A|nr:hypothetical protein [Leptospira wolffii]EPG64155.1 hypothetical protein LEP1GSC061_3916 [Leptospira wolffii serovar Khorat str. Khorat-H2]
MKGKNELNKTIERLIEDPDFSRRIASRIVVQAANREKERFPLKSWQALAAAILLGIGATFATYLLRTEKVQFSDYSGLSNQSAKAIASPIETEYAWEATDLIIEASFSER